MQTTGVTDEEVQVEIQVGNKKQTLTLFKAGDGKYTGKTTLSTPSFSKGRVDVTITTKGKPKDTFPDGVMIARYTWFQRGEPLLYVDQGPDPWDGYSASGGSAALSAVVRTKVFRFETPIMLKPAFHDEGDYSGNDFWANVLTVANREDELKVALEMISMDAKWELTPDTSKQEGNEDGNADIGEWLPRDNGVSVGQWRKVLPQAVGKTVSIPIVDPAVKQTGSGLSNWSWKIQAFAAFEVTDVQIDNNRVTIIGQFVHWLDTGEHSDEKPPGLYIETAVLTE